MFFNGQYVWHARVDGADNYKFVSQAAVLQAFRSAPVDSGWLAPNVARCGSTSRGDYAVLFVPSGRHNLNVESGAKIKQLRVWLPSFVFFGYGQGYYVWAVKSDRLQPTAPLFAAPLPNVFDGGGICWGQNTAPRSTASSIADAWNLFITSPFNGHAASHKVKSHTGDVRTVLRRLAAEGKRFPLSELRSAHHSLDARISSLIGGEPDYDT